MATYVEIASATVGSGGSASIAFSSIPSIYTDLKLVTSARGAASVAAEAIIVSFNSSSSGFSARFLYGDGTSAGSATDTTLLGYVSGNSNTASTFGTLETYIPNYSGSTNKSYSIDASSENNARYAIAMINSGIWSNTAAINAITLTMSSGNFAQYSTAYLYGIKKD
jgi:hypothetical protein